jgi:hypothetical protein
MAISLLLLVGAVAESNLCKGDECRLMVDDMETYVYWNEPGSYIYVDWRDGKSNCTAGSGNETGANVDRNILHDDPGPVLNGIKSMKYDYDNDGLVHNPCTMELERREYLYSKIEAQTANLDSGIGSDWSMAKVLQLSLHGLEGNNVTEPLWVQLQDGTKAYGAKVFYPNLWDLADEEWHTWEISLADFGVDLTNVVSIVIGIGNEGTNVPGGQGTLYFDDILLSCDISIPASKPSPSDGAWCVDPNVVLSWSGWSEEALHDVYIGTDRAAVANATTDSPEYKGDEVGTTYSAFGLEPCTKHYWRIDEVYGETVVAGDVWSFRTEGEDCCRCVKPPEGMVAWWPLDETGGNIARDLANDNDGMWVGSPRPVAGAVDGALYFDDRSDYIEVPDDPSLNFGEGDFSVDAWLRTSATSGSRVILDKRVESYRGYLMYLRSGDLSFQLADGRGTNYRSELFVADGEWHHVAVTVDRDDPNGLRLYVDGISETRDPTERTGNLSNGGNLLIAASCLGISSQFNGAIDEVELFNVALDADDVIDIFEAGGGGKCKCEPAPQYKDDIKWSQPPEISNVGCINGWDEVSDFNSGPIVADDWLCRDGRPIKGIHWWGSFVGWTEQKLPPVVPGAFHIGIWTDVPDPDPNNPDSLSHPGDLVWEKICETFVWSYAGCDVDPRGEATEYHSCFKFDQLLSPDEWFYQAANTEDGTVYWLSIAAIYNPADYSDPNFYPWGWKTRPHFYNDNSVGIDTLEGDRWPPAIGNVWGSGEAIEYPEGTSWDTAFVLATNREYEPKRTFWRDDVSRRTDLERDGVINFKDLAVLVSRWAEEADVAWSP